MEDDYCLDAEDYQDAYRDFFDKFLKCVNPEDQLPVKVSAYDVNEGEIVGEVINVTLQYIRQINCPPSLQGYLVHLVIEEITLLCKNSPEYCGLRQVEKSKFCTHIRHMFAYDDVITGIVLKRLSLYNAVLVAYAPLKLMQAVTSKVYEICKAYCAFNSKLKSLPPPPPTAFPLVAAGGIRNMRRKMEDRHVVLHDLHSIFNIQLDSVANYYAVFDGHGGQDAAVYCATHLHQYLVESTHYPTDPEGALRDAFLTTDAHFIAKSETQRIFGGSTAVCALILNKKLYVAWAGDSMAVLVQQNEIRKLVKPHRPNREVEMQRIEKMGGVVVWQSGIFRVNGILNVSRAIGDVQHKPFITSEPEIICETLNGTEDFLIIGSDGLWDFVDTEYTISLVYRMVRQDPHDLKQISRFLLQWAKHCGSQDNITVIVVFLTPPTKIASRPEPTQLHSMDSLYSKVLKDQLMGDIGIDDRQQSQEHRQQRDQNENGDGDAIDDNRLVIERTSNGKHENGSADYDYEDLGPETDVDAIDDIPDTCCTPLEKLSRELFPDEKSQQQVATEDEDHDAANEKPNYFEQKESFAQNDDYSPPPSPTTKSNQHALIAEADNVADSEDSEDEWNYYRVDPNKEKDSTTPVDETHDAKDLKNSSESLDEDNIDIQSQQIEDDSKCKSPSQEVLPELIDTNISAEGTLAEPEEKEEDSTLIDHKKDERDMDFQLNPDAAEFVPVSPSALGLSRMNHLMQGVIAGSPLKNTLGMDDIPVPSQREFEEEVCQRPSEIDNEERSNGDHLQRGNNDLTDFIGERQKMAGMPTGLDESEISSTKAEFGDESATSFLTATDFPRTGTSMMIDDSFADSERDSDYDISKDPMAMSFTPGDFKAALEKGVDLNAVHDLTGDDLGEENGTTEEDATVPEKPDSYADICANLHSDIHSFTQEQPDTHVEHCTESENLDPYDALVLKQEEHPIECTLPPETETMDRLQSSSTEQKDSELTFVETPETSEPKTSDDFLMDFESRRQSSPIEGRSLMDQDDHHEDLQSVESSLSVNTPEFIPSKEIHTVEQHLSPFDADTDVSKHVTEGSEETTALLDGQSLQQSSSKDQDTPSSLSPCPDLDCSPESGQISAVATSSTPPAISPVLDIDQRYPFTSLTFKEEPVSSSAPDVPILQNPLDLNVEPVFTAQSDLDDLSPAQETLSSFSAEPDNLTKSPTENVEFELPNSQPQESLMQDMDELVCPFRSKKFEEFSPQQEETVETKAEYICCDVEMSGTMDLDDQSNLTEDTHELVGLKEQYIGCNVEMSGTMDLDDQSNLTEDTQELVGLEEQLDAKPAAPVKPTTPVEMESHLTEDMKELSLDTPMMSTEDSKPHKEEIESAYSTEVYEENVMPADKFALHEEKQDLVELAAEAKELDADKPIEMLEPIETKLTVDVSEVTPPTISPEVPIVEVAQSAISPEVPAVEVAAPAIVLEMPITEATPSAVAPEVPAVEAELPVVAIEEPIIEAAAPAVAPEVPTVEAAPPAVAPEVPIVEEAPPAVSPEVPILEEAAPHVEATEMPIIEAAPHSEVTEAPIIEAAPPAVVPEMPIVEAAPPAIAPEVPIVEATPLEIASEVPTVETAPITIAPEIPLVEAAPIEERKEEILKIQEASNAPEVKEIVATEAIVPEVEVPTPKLAEVPPEVLTPELTPESTTEAAPPVAEVPPAEISSSAEVIPEVTQTSDTKITAIAATAAAAAAAATVTAAAATVKSTKAAAKAPTKPSKLLSASTKTPKSTPTSPSKSVSSSTRTTAPAAAKKPTTTSAASRPKATDTSVKAAVSSTTKAAPSTRVSLAARTTAAAKPPTTTRPSSSLTSKPKVPSSSTKLAEKKPTTNGDVKPLSKPSSKPPVSKSAVSTTSASASAAKSTTLVKSSTTARTSSAIGAAKTRPASAAQPAASKPATKLTTSGSTTAAARPKTASTTAMAPIKSKVSVTKSSPVIDKQIKETANKQISLARTSTSSATKTSRTSVSTTTTSSSLTKRTSTTKSSTTTATLSPKKAAPISRVTAKTSTKSSTTTTKGKVVQNGVSNNIEMTNTIITTSGKINDDVPKKDLSPVMAPTDNQLIVTAD